MKFNKKYVFTNPSPFSDSQPSPNVNTSLEENLSKARKVLGDMTVSRSLENSLIPLSHQSRSVGLSSIMIPREFVEANYRRTSSPSEKSTERIKKNKDKFQKEIKNHQKSLKNVNPKKMLNLKKKKNLKKMVSLRKLKNLKKMIDI